MKDDPFPLLAADMPLPREHGMTVTQAAMRWDQAFPCGNGPVGAMAYGNPQDETILLNHEALWYPLHEKPGEVPNMAQHLPKLREMLTQGRYTEGENFWNSKLKEFDYGLQRNPFTNPYHPAFDLLIHQPDKHDTAGIGRVGNYRRHLDFETGEDVATWTQDGSEYQRNLFVSRTDDVLVLRLRGSMPGTVTTDITLVPHNPQKEIYSMWMGRKKEYLLARKAYKGDPITYKTSVDDQSRLTLCGRYWDGREFGGVARVWAEGGSMKASADNKVKVSGADEVIIIVKLFANETSHEAVIELLKSTIESLSTDYDTLFTPHAKQHRELFLRMTLDLNGGNQRELSNKQLQELSTDVDSLSTALLERLFDYGRYLLISSSRPDGLPANLQGVWSGTWTPAWSSDYTTDENVQMCYWQALPGNMVEVCLPYFDYFDSLIPDWKTNARQIWGCRGIYSYMRHSDHGLIVQDAQWQFWTAGAGWLAQLYYDYYLYTGDRDFLAQRAFPFMKEVALFYEDFVVEDADGKYMFSPSHSPENIAVSKKNKESKSRTTINATMDVAVTKEVLTNLIAACEILDVEKEGVERWRKMLTKLPAYQLRPDGAIKEWIHPDLIGQPGHRHMVHIYPLFPGFEINGDKGDDAIREGCRLVLESKFNREGDFAAWSCAHQACAYARLGDADRTLECVRRVCLTCCPENLLSFCWTDGPFNMDANSGLSAAVLESLVYSRPGILKLFPSLPEAWSKGEVKGLLARGGIELRLNWDRDKVKVELLSKTAQTVTVKFPTKIIDLECPANDVVTSQADRDPQYRVLNLPAAKLVTIHARLAWAGRAEKPIK